MINIQEWIIINQAINISFVKICWFSKWVKILDSVLPLLLKIQAHQNYCKSRCIHATVSFLGEVTNYIYRSFPNHSTGRKRAHIFRGEGSDKERTGLAPRPNGIPLYKVNKMCPSLLRRLWLLVKVIWRKGRVPGCWQEAWGDIRSQGEELHTYQPVQNDIIAERGSEDLLRNLSKSTDHLPN